MARRDGDVQISVAGHALAFSDTKSGDGRARRRKIQRYWGEVFLLGLCMIHAAPRPHILVSRCDPIVCASELFEIAE